MDESTLEKLRTALQEERQQHMSLLGKHGADPYSEEVKNLDVGNEGFADSGQATEQRSELLGQLDSSRQRVRQIDKALEEMDEGTYGICSDCGDAIQPARLEVRPLSVKCVDCASKSS